MSNRATGKAWVAEYARAFGYEPATMARIFKCPEKQIVRIEDVAEYLKADPEWIAVLLENEDRAIPAKVVAERLYMGKATVHRKVKPDAVIPGEPQPTYAYSLKRIEEMAKEIKGVEIHPENNVGH